MPFPKADVVLHCGDISENGSPPSYNNAIKMLSIIDAELKLVIAGNHDIDLDPEYWASQGGAGADHKATMEI